MSPLVQNCEIERIDIFFLVSLPHFGVTHVPLAGQNMTHLYAQLRHSQVYPSINISIGILRRPRNAMESKHVKHVCTNALTEDVQSS